MNSIITIELSNLFTDLIKTYPITGKLSIDQKLVTLFVSFLTGYFTGFFEVLSNFISNYFREECYIKDRDKPDIYEYCINDISKIYSSLNYVEKAFPYSKTSSKVLNSITKKRYACSFGTKKEVIINLSNLELPYKNSINSSNPSGNGNGDVYYNLVSKKEVYYKERKIIVACFQYSDSILFKYFLYIKKKKSETKKDLDKFISQFINELQDYYINVISEKGETVQSNIFEIVDKNWMSTGSVHHKTPESLIGNSMQTVLEDTNKFIETLGPYYKKLNIGYKRVYLLYGPPGTGKTSIVNAISSKFMKPVYKITFNENEVSNDDYKKLLKSTSVDSIILFEDIDPDLFKENGVITKTSKEGGEIKITYNTILDILDGVNSVKGRLIFILTNSNVSDFGTALIRPGRVDIKLLVDYCSDQDIKDYINYFYTTLNVDPTDKIDSFVEELRNTHKDITFAMLENFFIRYLEDIESALENVNLFNK